MPVLSACSPYRLSSSHDDLLITLSPATANRPTGAVGVPFDAVLVPTSRPAGRLCFAADLARGLGCPLVIMCWDGRREEIDGVLSGRASTWVVLASAWPAMAPMSGLTSCRHIVAGERVYQDVAAKRNVGLALATMLGWRRVLFLDDDVRGLARARLRAAGLAMSSHRNIRAVSWQLRDFPDNSVVCHAARRLGEDQGVFVGGGALAVDIGADLPFFPSVYNEDWLFLYDLLAERAVAAGGDVGQLRFDPFDKPARARAQEFGDVLGEGLYHLLHEQAPVGVAEEPDYWDGVLFERRRFICRLQEALDSPPERHRSRRRTNVKVRMALDVALNRHHGYRPNPSPGGTITSGALAGFVRAWRADLPRWHEWLAGLPRVDTIADAVRHLALPAVSVVEGRVSPRTAGAGSRVPSRP